MSTASRPPSVEADLAFLRSIVEGGGKASATMAVVYLAGGLLYGLQCLFHIGQIFGVVAARDDDFAIWLYYPAVVFGLQAAAWSVAWVLKKKVWMLATAAGGWLTAVALGLLVRQSELYLYVCTAALFLLFALPGWIMLREARTSRAD